MRMLHVLYSRVWVFFGGLFALVLLGDIRQGVIDVVSLAFVLSLFLVGALTKASYLSPSKKLHWAWIVFIAFLFGGFLTSDSPGYSVTAIVRYCMAYLVFGYFAYAKEEIEAAKFLKGLLWFAFISVGLSFVTLAHRDLGGFLPGMNLLYPAYGHNHVVNIVVFIFPFIVREFTESRNVATVVAMAYLGSALALSRARGGLALLVLYCSWIFAAMRQRLGGMTKIGLGIATAFVVGAVLFSKSSVLLQRSGVLSTSVKGGPLESRLPYWAQASAAISSRPFFGYGPGTFYLVSRRFQKVPGTHSWYAHSFLLQTLAEVGIVGALGVGFILGYPLVAIVRSMAKLKRKDPLIVPLWHAVILVFLYSLVEMNLDFLVIWFLFWATLGFIYRHTRDDLADGIPVPLNGFFKTLCVLLALFYLSAVASTAVEVIGKNHTFSFLLQPHVTGKALTYLSKKSQAQQYSIGLPERTIKFFHKNDPEIAFGMAAYASQSGVMKSLPYLLQATDGDPLNQEYLTASLDGLVRGLPQKDIGILTLRMMARAPRITTQSKLFEMPGIEDDIGRALVSAYEKGKPRWSQWYAGLAYVLAMNALSDNPKLAEQLLLYARDVYPDLGFIHMDLIRFYESTLGDHDAAVEATRYCGFLNSPKKQCEVEDKTLPPGDFLYLFI